MRTILRMGATLMVTGAALAGAGCGGSSSNPPNQGSANGDVSRPSGATTAAPTPAPEHHSKLAGAAVGAVVGHELGAHALAGAAVGAAVQHHRNKKSKY